MKVKAKAKKAVKKAVKKVVKKTVKPTGALIRTNVNMEKSLHSKAKQVAAKGNISLNKLINTAIKEHLK